MRAHEFLNEAKEGKMEKNAARASTGTMLSRDIGGYDRVYHLNRMMMAMAQSDGKSKDAVNMDYDSYTEKYNTVHPYTEEEYNMFVSASKTIPTEKSIVQKYSRSQEPEDTNKQSLVKGFKGFKK